MRKHIPLTVLFAAMSLLLAGLPSLAATELATHPHVTRVTWTQKPHTLDWVTAEFSADESPAKPKRTRGFVIDYKAGEMASGLGVRRVDEEEVKSVGASMEYICTLVEKEILPGDYTLFSIEWNVAGEIFVFGYRVGQDNRSLTSFRLDLDSSRLMEIGLKGDETESRKVEDVSLAHFLGMSTAVVDYSTASVQWWDNGDGESLMEVARAR